MRFFFFFCRALSNGVLWKPTTMVEVKLLAYNLASISNSRNKPQFLYFQFCLRVTNQVEHSRAYLSSQRLRRWQQEHQGFMASLNSMKSCLKRTKLTTIPEPQPLTSMAPLVCFTFTHLFWRATSAAPLPIPKRSLLSWQDTVKKVLPLQKLFTSHLV